MGIMEKRKEAAMEGFGFGVRGYVGFIQGL